MRHFKKDSKEMLKKHGHSYMPMFDCFVRIVKTTYTIDNRKAYIVENKYEGIENYLALPEDLYGIMTGF